MAKVASRAQPSHGTKANDEEMRVVVTYEPGGPEVLKGEEVRAVHIGCTAVAS